MATIAGPRQALPSAIARTRIIAVLRATASTHLASVAVALSEGGITCIEVTLTTPRALSVIEELRSTLGDSAEIGAGTVMTVADLDGAWAAGASYTLSPCVDREVLDRAQELGTPHIPGAATPTEVATAWKGGAAAVKVFPASQLGGPPFIRALRDPFPQIALIPTGGVSEAQVADYLRAGALAVGVGTPLMGDVLIGGPNQEFRDRIERLVGAVRQLAVQR
jgi:2-dehydro-3-deoxyphosphogluconate aldolase/(4S)-4-hydroxy-2-oxoglutarate aldolase